MKVPGQWLPFCWAGCCWQFCSCCWFVIRASRSIAGCSILSSTVAALLEQQAVVTRDVAASARDATPLLARAAQAVIVDGRAFEPSQEVLLLVYGWGNPALGHRMLTSCVCARLLAGWLAEVGSVTQVAPMHCKQPRSSIPRRTAPDHTAGLGSNAASAPSPGRLNDPCQHTLTLGHITEPLQSSVSQLHSSNITVAHFPYDHAHLS